MIGDVRGQFKRAFARLSKINKVCCVHTTFHWFVGDSFYSFPNLLPPLVISQAHGPFAAAFCVGTFFANALQEDPLAELQPYLEGTKKSRIPYHNLSDV